MWGLLAQAAEMIPNDPVSYRKYKGKTKNAAGIYNDTYDAAVAVAGAFVQPVRSAMYAQLGIQLGKNVRQVFLPVNVAGMEDMSDGGDILVFEGKNWRIIAVDNWYAHDGWKSVIVEEEKVYSGL